MADEEGFIAKLKSDLSEIAAAVGAKVDPVCVTDSLCIFSPYFTKQSWIQMRFNHKPSKLPSLNWRCEVLAAGINSGAFPWDLHKRKKYSFPAAEFARPIDGLIKELTDKTETYSLGLDFDTTQGCCKIWHFGNTVVDTLLKQADADKALNRTLPASVRKSRDFLRKHNFADIYCTGVDLVNASMNFYFFFGERNVQEVVEILTELRCNCDLDKWKPLFTDCCHAEAFAITFRWDTLEIERVCFYIGAHTLETNELQQFYKDHSLPSLCDNPNSFVGCSFGKTGHYKKIETDYNRAYFSFLGEMVTLRESSGK
eukprot:TRINITY_DN10420_c0_g1_i1.p1 TRINITY_DN10420_c0_g1~~TRINITY_DN10420_c0_g1_i1.p1  ORF type:complete len:313 (+),score=36.21 TRINITY_DN10420_c0_g1_i1:25-963(+)